MAKHQHILIAQRTTGNNYVGHEDCRVLQLFGVISHPSSRRFDWLTFVWKKVNGEIESTTQAGTDSVEDALVRLDTFAMLGFATSD
jgi:hypothetical protein